MRETRGMKLPQQSRIGRIALVAALSLTVASCSSSSDEQADDDVIEDPLEYFGERTTINGESLPGVPATYISDFTMLDTINANGERLLITQGVRAAGTRAGIHVHQWGGHTCVLSGTITDFVEGHDEPMVFPAGTCYYMPPNTPMSAANLGDEDAILIDTFTLPVGGEPITILEPGYPGGPGEVSDF